MALGVVVLLPLALAAAGGLENATYRGMELAGDGFAFGPGANRNFLPLGLAFSYFVMWAISAMGQPSTIVRLMAFRDSRTLKTSIAYLAFYNAIVYIPLIIIFVCSRSILPDLKQPDEVMPTLVLKLSHPLVAGLILAAPYGAVMSTVSGFLLIIASGLVRDIYQRFLRPAASDREVARVSYAVMIVVGALVMLIAMKPPKYLQLIVVFASSAMATAFLVPVLLGCFWRRATAAGALAAMLAGTIATMCLYVGGMFLTHDQGIGAPPQGLVPYYLLGFEPVVWGLLASGLAGGLTSLLTRPPAAEVVSPLFDA
jgi:SSS family solute:Na+ symporter/sodium/pantothenate symporter